MDLGLKTPPEPSLEVQGSPLKITHSADIILSFITLTEQIQTSSKVISIKRY